MARELHSRPRHLEVIYYTEHHLGLVAEEEVGAQRGVEGFEIRTWLL